MKSEILAPVGNMEMLRPAVFSGADAVYLGLQSMNARKSAKGFSQEEIKQAVAFCHARDVNVYITLNTTLYSSELSELCSLVSAVCEAGVDAVIAQDLATVKAVKSIAPSLPLHGSTQMSVHTLAGAVMLRKIGFSRVILSRELSLSEIEYISKNAGLETEVFVHGALCMSVSGQCYMSSFLGGRSGNRGSCAGPCRLPFSASEPGLCHLSLKDMSHIQHLQSLEKAGVKSFKIEGRLRSEEYVAAAVNACVCSLCGENYDAKILQDVFSRSGFTESYITGKLDGTMFGVRTEEDTVAAKAAQPKLRELYRRERQSVGVDIEMSVCGNELFLRISDGVNTVNKAASFEPQPAKTDLSEALKKALSKCGGTPFYSKSVTITGAEGIFVPQSAVNELRRCALEELLQKRSELKPYKVNEYFSPVFPRILHNKKGIIARFESAEQIPQNLQDISRIIIPISEIDRIDTSLRKITWAELPRVMFGNIENEVKTIIEGADGFGGFVAENIAHFELLRDKNIMGGFSLNVTNPVAASFYRALGASVVTLSCEITASDAAFFEDETAIIAYAHMPLMITRACPLKNVRSCAGCTKSGTLLDRKNVRFPLLCKNDVRTVYNPIPLYMGDKRTELNVDYEILYFTIESKDKAAQIIEKFTSGQAFGDDFTRGLYFKGTV